MAAMGFRQEAGGYRQMRGDCGASGSGPEGRLLVLEPYFGGSHQQFIEGLCNHLGCPCTVLRLPARAWKWRMRLAALHFAEQLRDLSFHPDAVLCSSYVDVALLRAIGPPWLSSCRLVTYFHENQFAYPVQAEDQRDVHFPITNLTTAMASDVVLFNSGYNRDTFLKGAEALLRQAPDMDCGDALTAVARKSEVLAPGIEDAAECRADGREQNGPAVVLWNHRWEHDKNPEEFFEALFVLQQRNIPFELLVLGQRFRRVPAIFREAETKLADRLLHFGYVDRQQYHALLARADVVVSTVRHEFFGYSVLEAVFAGCRPLLPSRLSYPELFPAEYLYAEGTLIERLAESLAAGRLTPLLADELAGRFRWPRLVGRYRDIFFGMAFGR